MLLTASILPLMFLVVILWGSSTRNAKAMHKVSKKELPCQGRRKNLLRYIPEHPPAKNPAACKFGSDVR
eukprot:396636-Amphidinium_carterae.2